MIVAKPNHKGTRPPPCDISKQAMCMVRATANWVLRELRPVSFTFKNGPEVCFCSDSSCLFGLAVLANALTGASSDNLEGQAPQLRLHSAGPEGGLSKHGGARCGRAHASEVPGQKGKNIHKNQPSNVDSGK
eukprot:3416294-Amphidinium_carterae.1